MPNTQKKYYSRKHKTQKKSNRKTATVKQIRQNRLRNKIIRNIRMGRIYGGSGGSSSSGRQMVGGKGDFVSQFIGKPWTPDSSSLGSNYFPLSPKGGGTGVVPHFDDGQSLSSARYPTQLGPQLPKLGQLGGKRKRSRKNVKGGGVFSDFMNNVTYSWNKMNTTLEGVNSPPNPNPYNQPISKSMI